MAINYKFFLIITIIVIVVFVLSIQYYDDIFIQEKNSNQQIKFFDFKINTKGVNLINLQIDSIFTIYGVKDEYIIDGNYHKYTRLLFELNQNNSVLYDELKNTDEKTVVIFPLFTAAAYSQPGFYNYYKGECSVECLTVPLKLTLLTDIGGNGAQILKLLNYKFLTDIDIDKNPEIINSFDKVILLHNEYVTQKQFDAITSHPNIIYLYPNALYAKVDVDYEQNTITLIRGHGYPEENIGNGFNWEFDNTHPYEYDRKCDSWNFYEIDNGKMLNCFPEEQLYEDASLLRTLKEL